MVRFTIISDRHYQNYYNVLVLNVPSHQPFNRERHKLHTSAILLKLFFSPSPHSCSNLLPFPKEAELKPEPKGRFSIHLSYKACWVGVQPWLIENLLIQSYTANAGGINKLFKPACSAYIFCCWEKQMLFFKLCDRWSRYTSGPKLGWQN